MKKLVTICLISILGITSNWAQVSQLRQTKNGMRLYVEGKPFIILGGELHNSSTGSATYMSGIWKRMANNNLNTVFAAVSWETIEPHEGKFDFARVDSMLEGAHKNNLHLIVLWFGSWKNGNSSYTPEWVKENQKKYPLACFNNGEKMNTLSTLGKATMEADGNAFAVLMRHFKQVDTNHTVIAVQVENEMGTLDVASAYMGAPIRSARDYSPLANKTFKGQIPAALIQYLKGHEYSLHPAIAKAWKKHGKKMKGTWEEVFGLANDTVKVEVSNEYAKDAWMNTYPNLTQEIFNTWNYATYIESIASKGKAIYNIPLYANCWQKQPKQHEPGAYPSGGPQIHLLDIYHAAAPHIDLLEPDLYNTDIWDYVLTGYGKSNPILIPETVCTPDAAARAFYTFGHYNTIGYSPFGIDGNGISLNPIEGDESLKKTYKMLKNITPFINQYVGTDKINGLLLDKGHKSDNVIMSDYKIYAAGFKAVGSEAMTGVKSEEKKVRKDNVAGLIIFKTGKDEFIVAGGVGSIMVSFNLVSPKKDVHLAMESVDEILFKDDGSYELHRVNGDETAYGGVVIRDGEVKAYKIKLYRY